MTVPHLSVITTDQSWNERMEDYNGLVILATNMKSNIDSAFTRRFNSIIHFSFPGAIKFSSDTPTK
jgi:SpoVK/Ycf46/Vps4 family AAA+-type ATPase